ncbi:MAG: hypothetical protein ACFCU9_08265 [Cyanophyceae cyanobacterium]
MTISRPTFPSKPVIRTPWSGMNYHQVCLTTQHTRYQEAGILAEQLSQDRVQ